MSLVLLLSIGIIILMLKSDNTARANTARIGKSIIIKWSGHKNLVSEHLTLN